MLAHRLGRWPNIVPTLGVRLVFVFAGPDRKPGVNQEF